MLIGEAMKIGERATTSPLIWPALKKTFALLGLLIVMTIIEEAVVGLFHHHSIAASLGELFGARLEETIAGYVIMLLVLIPYAPSVSSTRRSAKVGWRGCSLSSGSQWIGGNRSLRCFQTPLNR